MSEIKAIREDRMARSKRFTQAEAARIAGVSIPTYRKLEENPENFTFAQAKALAEYLGCSAGDIFLGKMGN